MEIDAAIHQPEAHSSQYRGKVLLLILDIRNTEQLLADIEELSDRACSMRRWRSKGDRGLDRVLGFVDGQTTILSGRRRSGGES